MINRPLSDLLLVDNAMYSYYYQMDNGVPILPFYNDPEDTELRRLAAFLFKLERVQDMRVHLRKEFKLDLYDLYSNPETLIRELYL